MSGSESEWPRVKALFESARDLDSQDRAAFLRRECAGDAELLAEVQSLVVWDAGSSGFLDSPLVDLADGERDVPDPLLGARLGAYEITSLVGEGGMGTVYRAMRADATFDKTVAVKVIRRGLDTDRLARRFGRERRALAALDHPNIARLIDAGSTDLGRPYFVMEFVDGVPIDEYCDRARLTVDARLSLFRTVCAAVQYAHQNLIVHRDIKPANILVTPDGVPKLVDFGIAKLLHEAAHEAHASREETWVMTPAYASPEQVRGQPVTTAVDVYGLGVLLYELLSGRKPYDLEGRTPAEIERLVCVEEPRLASARVLEPVSGTAASDDAASIADRRSTTVRLLARRLANDVDTILQTALRKEPERRYRSVEQLADDVRRHLDGLPLTARPDTWSYRAAKFGRRHALGLSAAVFVVAALVAGIAGTAWQAKVAARERDRARAEAAKAERVTTLLGDMLSSPDPRVKGREVRVVDVLGEASKRIGSALEGEPDVESALLTTIGRSYHSIGEYDAAESHLRRALELQLRGRQARPQDVAATTYHLGIALLERGALDQAEPLLTRAHELYVQAYGPDHATVASVLNGLGSLAQSRGNSAKAEEYQREALAMRRRVLGPLHVDVADSLNDLAVVLGTRGDFKGAEPLHREALEIARRLYGPKHVDVAAAMMSLAYILEMNGDLAGADAMHRDTIAVRRELLGSEHPDTAWSLYSYAAFLHANGRYGEAETLCREVLRLRGRTLPDSHAMVASAQYVLGRSLVALGRASEAEPILAESLELRLATLPRDHRLVRSAQSALAGALISLKRYAQAEPLAIESYQGLRAQVGEEHPNTREALASLVRLYEAWHKPERLARYRPQPQTAR